MATESFIRRRDGEVVRYDGTNEVEVKTFVAARSNEYTSGEIIDDKLCFFSEYSIDILLAVNDLVVHVNPPGYLLGLTQTEFDAQYQTGEYEVA